MIRRLWIGLAVLGAVRLAIHMKHVTSDPWCFANPDRVSDRNVKASWAHERSGLHKPKNEKPSLCLWIGGIGFLHLKIAISTWYHNRQKCCCLTLCTSCLGGAIFINHASLPLETPETLGFPKLHLQHLKVSTVRLFNFNAFISSASWPGPVPVENSVGTWESPSRIPTNHQTLQINEKD